ncbi:MAG: endonuclease/exonuclease/phosphatase family protein, partial [Bacteroidaceae bacterium]|nr:endonuclease/exonuclease/phosphatase family protein [Bacteroidaceae bacterium]
VRGRSGMSIFSKWPFVGEIVYSTSQEYGNGSLACLINIDGDTTLVVNNHLQSNAISPQEKKDYISAISSINKDKMESSGRILLSRIAIAAEKRAEQTDTLCNLVERNQHRSIIVAGDMNDTPISYTYRRLTKHLKSAYRESGSGLGFSFLTKGFPVRIDHIFVSENLNTLFTYIDKEINSSDHLPILTRVSKSAK